jgi:hypothetical protein
MAKSFALPHREIGAPDAPQRGDLPAFVAYRRAPAIARYQSWSEGYSLAQRLLMGTCGHQRTPGATYDQAQENAP